MGLNPRASEVQAPAFAGVITISIFAREGGELFYRSMGVQPRVSILLTRVCIQWRGNKVWIKSSSLGGITFSLGGITLFPARGSAAIGP